MNIINKSVCSLCFQLKMIANNKSFESVELVKLPDDYSSPILKKLEFYHIKRHANSPMKTNCLFNVKNLSAKYCMVFNSFNAASDKNVPLNSSFMSCSISEKDFENIKLVQGEILNHGFNCQGINHMNSLLIMRENFRYIKIYLTSLDRSATKDDLLICPVVLIEESTTNRKTLNLTIGEFITLLESKKTKIGTYFKINIDFDIIVATDFKDINGEYIKFFAVPYMITLYDDELVNPSKPRPSVVAAPPQRQSFTYVGSTKGKGKTY